MSLPAGLRKLVDARGRLPNTPSPDHYRVGMAGEPANSWPTDTLHLGLGARDDMPSNLTSGQVLDALRQVALTAQRPLEQRCPMAFPGTFRELQREMAYLWVGWLIGRESSSRSFFLQNDRAKDETFYKVATSQAAPDLHERLRPKRHGDWTEWNNELKFLSLPEQLTITELELALAIFDWQSGRNAKFVWWVREHPHILWRIHDFLLSRYAFPLLQHFHDAVRQDRRTFARPPFRAGEAIWLMPGSSWLMTAPRVIGLTALGYLGLISLDLFVSFVFTASLAVVAPVGALAALAGLGLYVIDVFKQNRGVLAGLAHARPRIWRAAVLAWIWSLVASLIPFAIWWTLGATDGVTSDGRILQFPDGAVYDGLIVPDVRPSWNWNDIDGGRTLLMWIRWLALAATASVLGALVQWFWEDRSALDPI